MEPPYQNQSTNDRPLDLRSLPGPNDGTFHKPLSVRGKLVVGLFTVLCIAFVLFQLYSYTRPGRQLRDR
jgi:hypothetical protein